MGKKSLQQWCKLNPLGQALVFAQDYWVPACAMYALSDYKGWQHHQSGPEIWGNGMSGSWKFLVESCYSFLSRNVCENNPLVLILLWLLFMAFVKFTGSWETVHMFPVGGADVIGRAFYSYILFSTNRGGYMSSPRDWVIIGYTNPILLCQRFT